MNIGIDIGGSHVTMGLFDDEGNFEARSDVSYIPGNFNLEEVFASINQFIEYYSDMAENVGIGIPGIANEGVINYTCNLPITDVVVSDFIKTKLPVFISNDANCAAIAEYELVDKKMFNNYILVTIGTGIGAGLILNGSLYTGTTGSAGEIGHMTIEKDGLRCECGRRGCYERYASTSAFLRTLGVDSLKEAFYYIDKEHRLHNVLDEYVDKMAEGIANVINIYDPEMLVIGGGISEYEDRFLPLLKTKVAQKIYNKYTYDLNLKVAKLKNDAGAIGASMLHKYL